MRIASLTACTAAPLLAVLPQATRAWSSAKDDVAAMINGFVQDSRKDKALEHADALVGDGRPTIFGLVEAWLDRRTTRRARAYLISTTPRRFPRQACAL